MRAPFNEEIQAFARFDVVVVTIDDCSCFDAELRCCDFEVEDYDDLKTAAQRQVALVERHQIHQEKIRRSKVNLPKEPLYFAVHHRGKHLLNVRIKVRE